MPEQDLASFKGNILQIISSYKQALTAMKTTLASLIAKNLLKDNEKKSISTYLGNANSLERELESFEIRLKSLESLPPETLKEIKNSAGKFNQYIEQFNLLGQWAESVYSRENLTFESSKKTLKIHLVEFYKDFNEITGKNFDNPANESTPELEGYIKKVNEFLLSFHETEINYLLENIKTEITIEPFKKALKDIFTLKEQSKKLESHKAPATKQDFTLALFNKYVLAVVSLKLNTLNLIKELKGDRK